MVALERGGERESRIGHSSANLVGWCVGFTRPWLRE